MYEQEKQIIRGAMQNAQGDDLERAERAFERLNKAELDQEHGHSGKTRRQILDEYRKERLAWNSANKLVERLLATV